MAGSSRSSPRSKFAMRLVHFTRLDVALGGAAPDGDDALHALFFLERADVLAQLLDHLGLARAFLTCVAVQALHVLGIEHRWHRLDGLELVLDRGEMAILEHLGLARGLVGVVREEVPAAEHQIVE